MSKNTRANKSEKEGMSTGKKIVAGLAGLVIIFGGVNACNSEDSTVPVIESINETTTESTETSVVPEEGQEAPVEEQPAEESNDVPREYEQALKKAESYLNFSAFSYNGLYDQLTSEYGSGFTPEAAQYALDNVEVDWNEQAVKKAESYLEFSAFSEQGLYDQLTSEYGSGFTHEQAQYAIDRVY